MFRVRRMVLLGTVTGVSVTTVIAWATGWFTRASAFVTSQWDSLVAWVNSPVTMEHVVAAAGVLIVPVILLAILFAISHS